MPRMRIDETIFKLKHNPKSFGASFWTLHRIKLFIIALRLSSYVSFEGVLFGGDQYKIKLTIINRGKVMYFQYPKKALTYYIRNMHRFVPCPPYCPSLYWDY